MLDTNTIISEMLAPAVIISAIGLILLSMNNRFFAITGRIRDLNKEIREIYERKEITERNKRRLVVIKDQVEKMLKRCKIIKFAIFLLYASIGLVVLTVLALAADIFNVSLIIEDLSIILFIFALIMVLVAIIIEGFEATLAVNTVKEDFYNSYYEQAIDNINLETKVD